MKSEFKNSQCQIEYYPDQLFCFSPIGCCIEAACIRKANSTHKCKEIAVDQFKDENLKKKFRHHWIPGNLPLHSECEVCEEIRNIKNSVK